MKSFLEYVAEDILRRHGTNLADVAVVFPNKRAALFLNQHLAALAGKPIWAPQFITISQLFRSQSTLSVADPILSVATLFRAYNHHLASEQTIDHFWSWGEIMLADFDDIDKNMAQPNQVFQNVKDLHQLDNVDYLTDEQRRLLRAFFETFSDDHSSVLKQKFLGLWSHLADIYHTFNALMRQQGCAYEGALYRQVAEKAELNLQHRVYIFVGFNVLQKVEQVLFDRLRKEGRAEFYWDFDQYYVENDANEAGRYMRQYLQQFPNQLDCRDADIYRNFSRQKDIAYISASTEDIQARYIAQWLRQGTRLSDGERTAIVLADESLLKTVVHCLPREAEHVNITIGYPLQQSPVVALAKTFVVLHNSPVPTTRQAYSRQMVQAMLRHPYTYFITDQAEELLDRIATEKIFHPTPQQLCLDEGLEALFAPIEGEEAERVSQTIDRLVALLQLSGVKSRSTGDAFVEESIFRMYAVCNRLKALIDDGTLQVELATLQRLIDQIASSTTMPFHGEPAVGLQIMGVLETRNLDFDHILVLSASEGNIPKGVSDTSLLPHSVRKAFGLTTVENKIAIYAYYFYRLLQRCADITLTYNNSTEDGHTGQMSRFMLQLMVECDSLCIHHHTLIARQEPERPTTGEIPKTPEVMAMLHARTHFSPSGIAQYLRCPVKFYFDHVLGLKKLDDEDLLDNRVFGNIFHKAAEHMYNDIKTPSGLITPEAIDLLLSEEKKPKRLRLRKIYDYVDRAFAQEFFHIAPSQRPDYDGLQLINREVIVKYLVRLLKADRLLAPFTLLGLEQELNWPRFAFSTPEGERHTRIVGYIDRLDLIESNGSRRIRVVDYKTGSKEQGKINSVDEIFDPKKIDLHSDYYLQTMLYAAYVSQDRTLNPMGLAVSPALLFIQHSQKAEGHEISIGRPVTDVQPLAGEFLHALSRLLSEIHYPSIPFRPTPHRKRCQGCEFTQMCKRSAKENL